MTENTKLTLEFIKEKFLTADSGNDINWAYRYEHSLRVAGIGQRIAKSEGLDQEALIIACLLHDIGYIECKSEEDYDLHGRISERIAREFLTSIHLEADRIDTICYGIKIHTEAKEDYERIPTPFELSVQDADNIDRFDAYRLYGNLRYAFHMDEMTPKQMLDCAASRIERYEKYVNSECGTKTATVLWQDRIGFHLEYFKRLREQMLNMQDFCTELSIQ